MKTQTYYMRQIALIHIQMIINFSYTVIIFYLKTISHNIYKRSSEITFRVSKIIRKLKISNCYLV